MKMHIFQCGALLAVLAVASSQYLPGGSYLPPRRQISDSAIHKFLSAVRGGGRGHRELLTLTGSASSPPGYHSLQGPGGPGPVSHGGPLPAFGIGIGRLPPPPSSLNHISSAPPKLGTFYIAPPERNAVSYYGGGGPPPGGRRPPHLVKLSELKNARPFSFDTSETSNRPVGVPQQQGPPQGLQMYQVNGPLPAALSNGLPPHLLQGGRVPVQVPIQQNLVQVQTGPGGGPSGQSQSQSLQEIIAKAAQQQHAMVLQKEQKAHPNAQITNSQIFVPGAGAGQQPVFLNQFGQPFLSPAIFGPGGQPGGQLQQLIQGGPPPQQLPPHFFANGQLPPGIVFAQGPMQLPPNVRQQLQQQLQQQQQQGRPQNAPSQQQQQQQHPQQLQQQQQLSLAFLNAAGLQIPGQGQGGISLISGPGGGPQQGSEQGGPRGIPIQFGGNGQGQILNLPPGILPGNFAILPQQGQQGPFIPGNAILGQPHFALMGNLQQQLQQQHQQQQQHHQLQQQLQLQQQQQQQQQKSQQEKEEQPTRPQEAASSQHPVVSSDTPVPLSNGHGHMTAAIMQSQVEFAEPIVKL